MESTQPAAEATKEIVVFMIRNPSQCAECGEELFPGQFLRMENEKPHCMTCADLGHLEFLPRGNVAVTRRATKYSGLRAVVLQWARARKRYERQGILVEPGAIERAEEESLADADLRARRQLRAAARREELDEAYVAAFAEAIRQQYPGCPAAEAQSVAEHACRKYSGRVGRSAAAKALDPKAVLLAVMAHVRHEHTAYDEFLSAGEDRQFARSRVRPAVDEILQRWSGEAIPPPPAGATSPGSPPRSTRRARSLG